MASFFEHVLSLPLAFHTQTHSGRALKVMSDGSLSLGGIWLTFHDGKKVAIFQIEEALLVRRIPLESDLQITPIHSNRHRSALSPHPSSPEGSTA